jgi:hypothetical protein
MPCEARPNREQFARRAFARAPSAHPPTVARAPRTRNRAIIGVKTANAHAPTPCDTMQTERPWSSYPRRFGHSGAAASRWGLCLFSRVRRRQHHPRTGFAEPSCQAARIEPEDHRPDPDPRKTCSGTPSWFPAVWPIAPRHPSRSDSDAERPSGRYLTAGPMVRIRFPPPASPSHQCLPCLPPQRPGFCRECEPGRDQRTGRAGPEPARLGCCSLTGIAAVPLGKSKCSNEKSPGLGLGTLCCGSLFSSPGGCADRSNRAADRVR